MFVRLDNIATHASRTGTPSTLKHVLNTDRVLSCMMENDDVMLVLLLTIVD